MAELKKKIRSRNTHAIVIKKLLSSNIEDIYSNYTKDYTIIPRALIILKKS